MGALKYLLQKEFRQYIPRQGVYRTTIYSSCYTAYIAAYGRQLYY